MMAASRLTLPWILATISSALVLNVLTLGWAEDSKTVGTSQNRTAVGRLELEDRYWKPIWESVMNEYHVPTRVLERLNELKRIFDSASELPKEADDIKNKIDELVKLAQMDSELCKFGTIKALAMDSFNDDWLSESLHLYVQSFKNQFLSVCIGLILADMADSAFKIPEEPLWGPFELSDVLKRTVENARSGDVFDTRPSLSVDFSNLHAYRGQLIEAIASFLRQKWAKSNGRDERMPLDAVYEEHVISPCKEWLRATHRVLRIYKYINQKDILDDGMYRSIANGHLCELVYLDNEQIQNDLHKIFENPVQ